MALHAIGAADHQHRVIQHLQGALRLGGKIHMARCVQQGDVGITRCEQGLFGKDGDSTRFFQRVGVQKGVLVIHPAQAADHTGAVEMASQGGGLAEAPWARMPSTICLRVDSIRSVSLNAYSYLLYHGRGKRKSGATAVTPLFKRI